MTLSLYLGRVLAARAAAALVLLVALALGINLLDDAPAVLAEGGGAAVAEYAGLRALQLAAELDEVAVLAGSVLGVATLAARGEIVVLRAAGLSVWGLVLRLLPLAALFGAAVWWLGDRASPWAEARLVAAFPDVGGAAPLGAPLWVAAGDEAARLTLAPGGGAEALTVFRFDAEGGVTARLDAPAARWDGAVWRLEDATVTDDAGVRALDPPVWATPFDPRTVRVLARRPERVSAATARAALTGDAMVARGADFLRMRLAASWAAPLTPVVLLGFAALAAFARPREGGAGPAAAAMALGVGFVALDGAMAGLGAAGAAPPLAAALAPKAAGAMVAAWALLTADG